MYEITPEALRRLATVNAYLVDDVLGSTVEGERRVDVYLGCGRCRELPDGHLKLGG